MDFNYSKSELKLRNWVRTFAREKLLSIRDRVDSFDECSPEVRKLMVVAGIYRYVVPKEYGGAGLSSIAACIIREELSQVCTQADNAFAMSLFASQAIIAFGNDEQKSTYLPRMASGVIQGTTAITEPEVGSDVNAIKTTASKEGDYYILNGTKAFITMGAEAEACIVIAKVAPSLERKGISAFIVDCKNPQPGLRTSVMRLMSPHPCYVLEFKDYRVPQNRLLGAEGDGLKVVLSMLGRARATVAAAALGMAISAYEEAAEFAEKRVAFKRPIIQFQAIQLKMADMLTAIEATRLITLRAAWTRDHEENEESMKQASMAKLFGTESCQRVIDEAVQIFGGMGVVIGSRVEYLYRTIRALRIYEGTSDIQRLTITRADRAQRQRVRTVMGPVISIG